MTEVGAGAGTSEGARVHAARPRQNPRTSAGPMRRVERHFIRDSSRDLTPCALALRGATASMATRFSAVSATSADAALSSR
jgi:hypothetical protein